MSMAEGDLSAGLVDAMTEQDPGLGEQSGDQGASAGAPAAGYDPTGLSPYAQNFLAGLPEGERAKASEYVRNWDRGYQQQSQQLHSQLRPYQQLGDHATVSQAVQIVQRLQTDPHGFVQALIDAGYGPAQIKQAVQGAQQTVAGATESDTSGLSPQLQQELNDLRQFKQQAGTWQQRMEAAVGGLAQQFQTTQSQREAAEADKFLADLTADAHSRLGAFDDNVVYTIMRMNPGLEIDAAVQQFRNMVAQYKAPQAPGVMSSSSMPNPAPGSLKTADERNQAIVAMLNQLEQQ